MYQAIRFKNTANLLALTVLTILSASTSFAQVDYSTFNYPDAMGGSTFLTGVRGAGGGSVYVTGTFRPQGSQDTQGLLYQGLLDGTGQWTVLNFPSTSGVTVTRNALYDRGRIQRNKLRRNRSRLPCELGFVDTDALRLDIVRLWERPHQGRRLAFRRHYRRQSRRVLSHRRLGRCGSAQSRSIFRACPSYA